MLEGPHTTTTDAPDSSDVVLVSRDLLERLQGELKFRYVFRFIVTAHSGIVTSDSGHRDRGVNHRFRQRDRRFR
jgi:hypothetical protein